MIPHGEAYTIREWADLCFKKLDLKTADWIEINPDFVAEYKTLISNPSLINSLGWKPIMNMEKLTELMIGETNNG